ncbi:hypothetical protein Mal35_16750 [Gimesia maris]|uniref:hypothetical protein n=1 Tax=Gimesia maris TaxID=122 RepID=UPI00118AD393|nr:hypothetical protein [Gimesia maris]QDT78243.1 hypothetical protein Mal35_16750 [Gimesia maris]
MSHHQLDEPEQITLFGYSERGMINAVCDDLVNATEPIKAINALFMLCQFPFSTEFDFDSIVKVTVIVEQAFAKYGDLDLLLLLDYSNGRKQSVLIEGKVHTDTDSPKTLGSRWCDFDEYLRGNKKDRSNLFVQIYRKQRLIRQLADVNARLLRDAVSDEWTLGGNQVVRRAANLLKEYRDDPWYVCLVPDSPDEAMQFFETTLVKFRPAPLLLPNWDVKRWGFITWSQIETLARRDPEVWKRTVLNFDWNSGQIYRKTVTNESVTSDVERFRHYRYGKDVVVVVLSRKKDQLCRVVSLHSEGPYFPKTKKVSKSRLEATENRGIISSLQPRLRTGYRWQPQEDVSYQPNGRARAPTPPRIVKVTTPGWETSEVVELGENKKIVGGYFHVYNHHLLKTEQ